MFLFVLPAQGKFIMVLVRFVTVIILITMKPSMFLSVGLVILKVVTQSLL